MLRRGSSACIARWAIIERELRRFRRSPTLIVISMVFPLVQLVVLGYAFGGNVKHLKRRRRRPGPRRAGGQDARAGAARSPPAPGRSTSIEYADPGQALDGPAQRPRQRRADDSARLLAPRAGENRAARRAHRGQHRQLRRRRRWPRRSAAARRRLQRAGGRRAPRCRARPTLDVVEVYPYVPYIQYLLPGSIVMSIFMMVMIGGGIIFIDDKARGLHEGYLVTPITQARADRRASTSRARSRRCWPGMVLMIDRLAHRRRSRIRSIRCGCSACSSSSR